MRISKVGSSGTEICEVRYFLQRDENKPQYENEPCVDSGPE